MFIKTKFSFWPLIFLVSLNAKAFTFNNNGAAAFDKDEIIINVNDTDCAGADSGHSVYECQNNFSTPQEILDLAEIAIDRFWNRIPTTRLTLVRGSLISSGTDFRRESLCNEGLSSGACTPNSTIKVSSDITISCNCSKNNFGDSNLGILGVTIPNNYEGSTIKGSLILLNARHSSFYNLTKNEKINVIGHEIGHALGLGHSPVKDSLMYYSNIGQRDHLGWDDLDGISYLYPSSQPLSLACGTITSSKGPKLKDIFMALSLSFFSLIIISRLIRYFFLKGFQKAL